MRVKGDKELPLLLGSGFLRACQGTVDGILGPYVRQVRSKGRHFYNRDRWTLNAFTDAFVSWSRGSNNRDRKITDRILQAWVDKANTQEVSDPHIMIAHIPRDLPLRVGLALQGGAAHEAWHTTYSRRSPLSVDDVRFVSDLWDKIHDWSLMGDAILTWTNIIEDVRIERCGRADYPGTDGLMHDLNQWVLAQESEYLGSPSTGGSVSVIHLIFRDIGKGYNNGVQRETLARYLSEFPQEASVVLNGPLTEILKEAMSLGPGDDTDCLRLAMEAIIALHQYEDQGAGSSSEGEEESEEDSEEGSEDSEEEDSEDGGSDEDSEDGGSEGDGSEDGEGSGEGDSSEGEGSGEGDSSEGEGSGEGDSSEGEGGSGGSEGEGSGEGDPSEGEGGSGGSEGEGSGEDDSSEGDGDGGSEGDPSEDVSGGDTGEDIGGEGGEGSEEGGESGGKESAGSGEEATHISMDGILGGDWSAFEDNPAPWSVVRDYLDRVEDGSLVLPEETSGLLEDVLQGILLKEALDVESGERAYQIPPEALDVQWVQPSILGKDHDRQLAQEAKTHSQGQATYFQAKMRNLARALTQTSTYHGVRKGRNISDRYLVSSRGDILSGKPPRRAYYEKDEQVDFEMAAAVVLDESSSMSDWMGEAAQAMMTITFPLEQIGCATMAIGFRDAPVRQGYGDGVRNARIDVFKVFGERSSSVLWRFSRTTAKGGTPMAPGIQYAWDALQVRPEAHKVIFVVTDGAPWDRTSVRWQIRKIKEQQIHIVGVGMTPHAEYVQTMFPDHVYAPDPKDLAVLLSKKMESIVGTRLRRGRL